MSMFIRQQFTQFLSNPTTQKSAIGVTLRIVTAMNNQMVKNNVTMTDDHFAAAKKSMLKGDTLCDYLNAENPHVIASTGTGWAYNAGKCFHKTLGKFQE